MWEWIWKINGWSTDSIFRCDMLVLLNNPFEIKTIKGNIRPFTLPKQRGGRTSDSKLKNISLSDWANCVEFFSNKGWLVGMLISSYRLFESERFNTLKSFHVILNCNNRMKRSTLPGILLVTKHIISIYSSVSVVNICSSPCLEPRGDTRLYLWHAYREMNSSLYPFIT